MEDRKIRVAITHGDTNGVGYELIMKAFDDPAMLELCTPIVYGSPKVAAYHRKALNLETPNFSIVNSVDDVKDGRLNLLAVFDEEVKVELGQPSAEAGEAALKALDKAMEDYREGAFDVLVMAPVNKSTIPHFYGHGDYVWRQAGEGRQPLSVLLSEDLRVALVTNNVPLKGVSEAISKEKIIMKATIFNDCLRRDLRISAPRIAVLALNPHAGDDGQLGEEEHEMITPAIEELEKQGIQAFGPYPADEFFGGGLYLRFDGILAMYYDQGMAPFRSIITDGSVSYTAGLPIISTAPDQGTGYDIAGKNEADALQMRHAIWTAVDMFRNRLNYDEPLANPLPKLYKEKRDDSEKVRFAQPKQPREPREPRAPREHRENKEQAQTPAETASE